MEPPDDELSPGTSWDIGLVSLDDSGGSVTRTTWVGGPEGQSLPKFSPDGRYVAYTSWRSVQSEVYVRPFDTSEEENVEHQVSSNGGDQATWSPDGKTLYYVERGPDRRKKLMAATILEDVLQTAEGELPRIEIGEAKELFGLRTFDGSEKHIEIMPDGTGFLRNEIVSQEGDEEVYDDPTVIHVVRNFFTELERVAPTKIRRTESGSKR